MKLTFIMLGVLASTSWASPSWGSEPLFLWRTHCAWPTWCGGCAKVPRCCPDDYCPKQLPAIPCFINRCLPDEYCPKKLPLACPIARGCVDDYCPKKCPVCTPVNLNGMRCGECLGHPPCAVSTHDKKVDH